jgi:flagellar biosynthesis chaperone FliJ
MSVLDTLHRVRTYQRQQSALQLKLAQVERDRQSEKVRELQDAMLAAREAVQPRDANSVNEYQAWRLRQELVMRRESARLSQRERDVELQQDRHTHNVREELTLQTVITAREEEEALEQRRAEARWMDEIASRRMP